MFHVKYEKGKSMSSNKKVDGTKMFQEKLVYLDMTHVRRKWQKYANRFFDV